MTKPISAHLPHSKHHENGADTPLRKPTLQSLLPIALVLLVGSLLASSLIFGKVAIAAGASPLAFLCVSLVASGICLWLFSLFRGQGTAFSGPIIEYGLIAGLLFLLPNIIAFLAFQHVGAGFVSMTFLFPLLITYIFALFIGLERFLKWRAAAVVIGLSGGVLLAASKAQLGDAALGWVLLSLCGPVIIAIGNLYRTVRWPKGVAPLFLAGIMLFFAGLLLMPVVFLTEGAEAFAGLLNQGVFPILLVQILIFSALYCFFFILQKVAGPVYLSQIGSVAAIVGATIANVGLGEKLPPNLALSAFLVGLGVLLFQSTMKKEG